LEGFPETPLNENPWNVFFSPFSSSTTLTVNKIVTLYSDSSTFLIAKKDFLKKCWDLGGPN
jgi:hypothetical protein